MEDNENMNNIVIEDDANSTNTKRGRVFIKNLPFTITEEKLKKEFEKFGEISEVRIFNTDKHTKKWGSAKRFCIY
jgi:RNA recognition motif-containing protein